MESSSVYSQVQDLSMTPDIPVVKYILITIGVSEGQSSEELLTETLPTAFPLQLITACLFSLNFPKEEPVCFQFDQKSLRLMKLLIGKFLLIPTIFL